jgi:hypothetical protein
MVRRGFLGLLLASPAIAKNTLNEGALDVIQDVASHSGSNAVCNIGKEDPIRRAAFRYLEDIGERKRRRDTPIKHMPSHISEKKSWSPAFKAHVHAKEHRRNVWDLPEDQIISQAIKAGFSIATK